MNQDRQAIGQRLRARREAKNESLRSLASKVGISHVTLRQIELGRSPLTIERLTALAAALNLSVPEIGSDLASGVEGEPVVNTTDASWRAYEPLGLDPVLTAARDCIVKQGYHGCTMREIAIEAGLSVAGVYHHHATKQSMLVSLMLATMRDLLWRLEAARSEARSCDAGFVNLIESLALFHVYRRELAFIGASEMRSIDEPDRGVIVGMRKQVEDMVASALRTGVAHGRLSVVDLEDATRAVTTMCTSLATWFRPDGVKSPEDIARRYSYMALDLANGNENDLGHDCEMCESINKKF